MVERKGETKMSKEEEQDEKEFQAAWEIFNELKRIYTLEQQARYFFMEGRLTLRKKEGKDG